MGNHGNYGGGKEMKQKYYSLKNILQHNANYNLIYGERSNGKSYAIKTHCIKKAYQKKAQTFVLLRRYELEVKASAVESYFADIPVETITNGEYDCITVSRSYIYLSKYDTENNKVIKGLAIGRALYLSGATHFKSQSFPDCEDVIYEEFLTKNVYINDEPNVLMDLISTIARRRFIQVFLIGNTISRVCPYLYEWGLIKGIKKQQQGTIDDYIFHTDQQDENGNDIDIKIAVEYAENSGSNSKMFFGEHSKSITRGAWETHQQPHLLRPQSEYTMCYELLIICDGFQFVLQLLSNNDGGLINFVYPFTGTRNIYRIIQKDFSDLPNITAGFKTEIKAENLILNNIISKKTCYADNLTGEEFQQVVKQLNI